MGNEWVSADLRSGFRGELGRKELQAQRSRDLLGLEHRRPPFGVWVKRWPFILGQHRHTKVRACVADCRDVHSWPGNGAVSHFAGKALFFSAASAKGGYPQ